ncbi:uncharacterized protein LOC111380098 [Olea europaea var. sylvestris]|uniref:uncharacterized protein LOC111380098 n=1 Tax=Olea europaea var. sylvestris TaxID=158386 RepID=UPI000C1D2F5B|nr:uncharacterized protein LOC111380098 [Olea europaea var. sylvestris]
MAEKTLVNLRALMASHSPKLDALVVPSEDYHQSEYVSDRDKRREFVSGFTGSAGLALITANEALLWTDGRYFLQASQQLSEQWKLMRMGEDPAVDIWMVDNLPKDAAIGIDPWCVSVDTAQKWERAFAKKQQKLVQTSSNLVDEVWKSRPPLEINPVIVHPLEFSGRSVQEKLKDLREKLVQEKAHAIIITALDEVAWLYNIRGTDTYHIHITRHKYDNIDIFLQKVLSNALLGSCNRNRKPATAFSSDFSLPHATNKFFATRRTMNQIDDDQMVLISQYYTGVVYDQLLPEQVEAKARPRRRRKKNKGEAGSCSGVMRKRKLSEQQMNLLEQSFEDEHKLESERKDKLASDLGLDPRQVAVWFQNRRARWKSKKMEEEYSKLKTQHETTVVEKCRLENEVRIFL